MPRFFTSGYEGNNSEDFFAKLKKDKIDILIDVRQNPFSFKQGFNRSQLQILASQKNIYYVHIKELGTPVPIRKKLKEFHNYRQFFSEYTDFLREYQDIVEDLVRLSMEKRVCIICFEKDENFCHRKVIAKQVHILSGGALKVCHL